MSNASDPASPRPASPPAPARGPSAPAATVGGADRPERRRNAALRELIDEMLASIRAATSNELWTGEERAQYEKELADIMARVRSEAVGRTPQ